MKKILSLILVFILLISVSLLSLSAAETVTFPENEGLTHDSESISDIFLGWEKGGYPDKVGGFECIMTGFDPAEPDILPHEKAIIFVTENMTGEEKENIRQLFRENTDIVFETCLYSYNEASITAKKLSDDIAGYRKKSNCISIQIACMGAGENKSPISVFAAGDGLEGLYGFILKKYGNDVYYEEIDYDLFIESGIPESGFGFTPYRQSMEQSPALPSVSKTPEILLFTFIIIALVATAAFILFKIRKKRMSFSMALSNGETVQGNNTVTEKYVEDKIKSTVYTPSEKTDEELFKKLGK